MANEKRLIDANALLASHWWDSLTNEFDKARAKIVIMSAPTVDAVEVIHAYWTGSRFNPMTDEYEEYCSHCCAWSPEYGKPYCPNCGAKMDGDGNG